MSVALLLLAALCLMLGLVSCKALALSGEKKYKVDLQNALLKINEQVEQDGSISDSAVAKLQGVLERYEEDFSKRGSFIQTTKLIELMAKIREEPQNEFMLNQSVLVMITDIQDTLKTEVQE